MNLVDIQISGFEKVEENIAKVIRQLSPEQIEGVLLEGANVIGQAAINLAPIGPTGNLKRSIVAKVLQRNSPGEAAPAITAVDYRIAPHAHLIEFGHLIKRGKRGKSTGFVEPHPFMRPAWDATKDQVAGAIVEEFHSLIEEAPG